MNSRLSLLTIPIVWIAGQICMFGETDAAEQQITVVLCDKAQAVILGHAMAHELGHLLGRQHALSGIMVARWGTRERGGRNSSLAQGPDESIT